MALSYSLTVPKLGDISASSLVKSAATLTNELNTYQDTIEKINFETNPTDENFNNYVSYLQGRINTLRTAGTITDLTKAANLTQTINSAYKTNTSFNIDTISTQMLAGDASDSTKLDFLANNVLQNPIVQGDPAMYAKYMQQAYGLQQSIQYQTQQQQTAAEVTAQANLTAQERGFTSAEDALKSNWTQLDDAYKNGDMAAVNKAFKSSMAIMAPIYKASGVTIPKNFSGDLQTAHVGDLLGLASFYEHAAQAAGPDNPDYQSYVTKAQNVIQGSELKVALTEALAPKDLYSPSTNAMGQVSQVQNLITGYNRVAVTIPGLQPVTMNIPTTNGLAEDSLKELGTGGIKSLESKLNGLGLNILSSKGGYLRVNVSNNASKWLGNNKDLIGQDLTVIPTRDGLQFEDDNNDLFGVSFDSRGLAGLYKAGLNNQWNLVGGQYGFSPKTTPTAISANPGIIARAPQLSNGMIGSINPFINSTPTNRGPQMIQRAGGGFNFIGSNGKPISAFSYAMLTHQAPRSLLQTMANRGDAGARQVLGFVGNDFHYDPTKIGNGNNAQLYNDMAWGAEPMARVGAPSFSGGQLTLPSGLRL